MIALVSSPLERPEIDCVTAPPAPVSAVAVGLVAVTEFEIADVTMRSFPRLPRRNPIRVGELPPPPFYRSRPAPLQVLVLLLEQLEDRLRGGVGLRKHG